MLRDPQNKLIYDSEEGVLIFDIEEFLKVFFYHVLYHFAIGPFACLVIVPFESWNYVRNLKFIDWHRGLPIQLFPWLIHGYVLYVIMTSEEEIISNVVIPVSIFWYFLRISVISTRYATETPSQMKRYRSEYISDIDNEYMIFGWFLAGPKEF